MNQRSMSVPLFNYLCCNIGHEHIIKTRRLCNQITEHLIYPIMSVIPSGSKAEGLDFRDSDDDTMFLIEIVTVYEHPTYCKSIDSFILSSEDTTPGYFRLTSYGIITPSVRSWCIEQGKNVLLLSNKLFKEYYLSDFPIEGIIHGPCIADKDERYDWALCFRCASWIQQAQPWIQRKREWPSPNIIHKIISCGVLFVPIGSKDSPNEDIEWRVSFSIAEKQLIFSFSHTQFLCYALMKICLKEVINLNQSCKGLLCSYFIKTVLFWVSEELPVYFWRQGNIIACFQHVMKRLIFFIKFDILPHFFITENNLFRKRFNDVQVSNLLNLLSELNQRGIYCFRQSKAMSGFFSNQICPVEISKMDYIYSQLISFSNSGFRASQHIATLERLFRLLTSYKLTSNRFLYSTLTSILAKHISWRGIDILEFSNKYFYKLHRNKLPYFIIGLQSDALSGWLHLATYFYYIKQYRISLHSTLLTLSKCHSKNIISSDYMYIGFDSILSSVEHEAVHYGVINAFHIRQRHLTDEILFSTLSCYIPVELEIESRIRIAFTKSPIMYGMFIRFLCLYHLQDQPGFTCALQDLYDVRNYLTRYDYHLDWNIFMGQAHYILGNFRTAISYFTTVAELEQSFSYRNFNKIQRVCRIHDKCYTTEDIKAGLYLNSLVLGLL